MSVPARRQLRGASGPVPAAERVVDRRVLAPDPRLIKSLGSHHDLKTAVADLVDNCVDAGARRVLVRFDLDADRSTGLTVVDDGRGMDSDQADEAMRLGGRKAYERTSHGHFGIGLKSASFSHAATLTVLTSSHPGEYHGRRLVKADVQRDYGCDILDPAPVGVQLRNLLKLLGADTGTVVRWTDTDLPAGSGPDVGRWLDDARAQLRMHLGLVYHRLLEDGRLSVDIEIHDLLAGTSGAPESVAPIDPVGFSTTAVTGYPTTLIVATGSTDVPMRCHIVPPRSSGPGYRLYGRDGAESQGFFIYRSDRLIQAGGWNQVASADRNRALARVVIDDFDALAPHVRLNPEKTGIVFGHALRAGIGQATGRPDGPSFVAYLERAEAVLVDSRRRRRRRTPVVNPSKGLHEDVRRVVRAEVPIRADEDPVEMRWRRMPADRFLQLDRENRVIYLNQRHRQMLTGGVTGLSDAPLVKTLVYLLTENHFTGQYWGARDKDLLDVWEVVLGAAAETEAEYRARRAR